jgi:cephalosporin hydroxylase
MTTLLELYSKYDSSLDVEYPSDKNSYHTYIEDVYEEYLKPYRNKKINLLEIGVSWSGSIRLWNDYFRYAKVYGVDNFSCGNQYRDKSIDLIEGKKKRVSIIEGNAYSPDVVEQLPDLDVIIDDGPHTVFSQKECIRLYLPKLKSGGIMFIEDIVVDFQYSYIDDELENHPNIRPLIDEIPEFKYEYEIFDLRRNAADRVDNPAEGRGDNVILAIRPVGVIEE